MHARMGSVWHTAHPVFCRSSLISLLKPRVSCIDCLPCWALALPRHPCATHFKHIESFTSSHPYSIRLAHANTIHALLLR
jgi:hypothetical protein